MSDMCTDNHMDSYSSYDRFTTGNHPDQILERIRNTMNLNEIDFYQSVSLSWIYKGDRVGVYLNETFFGVFDYKKNTFENIASQLN